MKKLLKPSLTLIFLCILSFSLFSCEKSEFKVTFIVDGENYFTTQATGNATVEIPENPKKDEHSFDGWFVDAGKWTVPFDKNYFIDKDYSTDIYVYAKWTYFHTHAAGEWVTETEPSCADEGVKIKKCIHCDEIIEREAIPTLPHTEVTVNGFAGTDTTDGLTDGSFCSVCSTIVKSQKLIPALIQGTELKSELFEINGLVLSVTLPNSTSEISITENIKINHKATASVAYDEDGKKPSENTVKLSEGDNKFYLTVANNAELEIYEINIRRRPNYTLTFYAADGEPVAKITVEEGGLATAPELNISKVGYTFGGWSFDFSLPVNGDASVNAVWTPSDSTAYTVEHYIKNRDGSFSLYDSKSLAGTTDSLVTAEALSIENYAYKEELSTALGRIMPDGSLTLKLYYEKVVFTVAFDTACDEKIENSSVKLNSPVEEPKKITNGNRVLIGWYLGEEKWDFSADTVAEDITLSAKWGYTVTFIIDGNETAVTVEEGKSVPIPDIPKKDKFIFDGWFISGTNEIWSFDTPITENIILEAKWIPALPIAPI